jgi:hypothetical protein
MPTLGDRAVLQGKRFGLWLVVGDAPDILEGWYNRRGRRTPRRTRMLLCRCHCGREAAVRYYALARGRSQGCEECRPGGKPSREEDWFEALDLYRKGYTYRAIGLKLGVGQVGARRLAQKAREYLREQEQTRRNGNGNSY